METKRKISFKIESAAKRRKDFLQTKYLDPNTALAAYPPDPYFPILSDEARAEQAENDAFDAQQQGEPMDVEREEYNSSRTAFEQFMESVVQKDAESYNKESKSVWDIIRTAKYAKPAGSPHSSWLQSLNRPYA
jgi:hypothetical protein